MPDDLMKIFGHPSVEARQRELHVKFCNACLGYDLKLHVAGALINLLVTIVRRIHPKAADAEAQWDSLTGQGKEHLLQQYQPILRVADSLLERNST